MIPAVGRRFRWGTAFLLKGTTDLLVVLLIAALAQPSVASSLRIGVSTLAPEKANPYQGITVPAVVVAHAIFDSLTGLDEQGNVIPQLALSWESKDAIAWRFNLRPDVRFSNGEPFNATALVVSVEHMRSAKGRTETIGSTLYHIESVIVIDDLTVDIKLSEPDALFPIHATIWRIPAPGAWQELGLPDFGSKPSGTGPFQLVDWNDQRAKLRAYPGSWRPPRLDELTFLRIADQAARLQGLLSGALDVAMELAPEDRLAIERSQGQFVVRLTPSVHFLAFLTENESPVKDVRVRRALNYAVNREAIVTHLLDGATVPTGQLAFPGSFGHNPSIEPYSYDPEKARSLLREAGYGDGLKVTLSVSLTGGNDALYYQQIAADLSKVGVEVNLQARPRSLLITGLFSGDIGGDLFNLLVRGHDPLNAYRHRSCLSIVVDRAPYHCDATLVPWLEEARRQPDAQSALSYYHRVLAHERDHPPGIFLWQAPAFDGLSEGVGNYKPSQDVINYHQLSMDN